MPPRDAGLGRQRSKHDLSYLPTGGQNEPTTYPPDPLDRTPVRLRHRPPPRPSAAPLTATVARAITDNDAAFLSKLKLVEGAKTSIDLMYYIYADDFSSSTLSKALIDAAGRGVKVRLLVDYHTNYKRLDLFALLEKEGGGNLLVRFYNRPTRNIVKDAVYMTMGCGTQTAPPVAGACSAEKYAAIDLLFAKETIDGQPVGSRNISNLNIGTSGLFLSGLYAKRPDLMAQAPLQSELKTNNLHWFWAANPGGSRWIEPTQGDYDAHLRWSE